MGSMFFMQLGGYEIPRRMAGGVSGAAGAAVPPAGAGCLAACLLCFSTQVLTKASILSALTCCFSALALHISSGDLAAKVDMDTPDSKATAAVKTISFFLRSISITKVMMQIKRQPEGAVSAYR